MRQLESCPICESEDIATDPPFMDVDETLFLNGEVYITWMQMVICGWCGFNDIWILQEADEDIVVNIN